MKELIATHGYWVVAAIVAAESTGVPVPGETVLVSAAIYAGTTHRLDIWMVILCAAIGAIAGGNIGYGIGRGFGHRFLLKHGDWLHMTPRRIKLGQYLFHHHGGKVVFVGRFFAFLRALASLFAGVNCMDWRRFQFFNTTSGLLWALLFGYSAFRLGEKLEDMRRSAAVLLTVLAVLAVAASFWFIRRHEATLEDRAEREFPGPVR